MSRNRAFGGVDPSLVPRVLLGAVDGVEIVAVGTLQLARDVLLSAVSGAANIGAEAVSATVTGSRGVVAATSRLVEDIAGAARSTLRATLDNARRSRRGPVRLTPSGPAPSLTREPVARTSSAPPSERPRSRRRPRRLRATTRPIRPSVAA